MDINWLPWKCLYWEKDTTRICCSTARVQFGCWSGGDIPTVPSMAAQPSSGLVICWCQSWAGRAAEQTQRLVEAAHLITQSRRKDWIGRLWRGEIGFFSQAAGDRQGEMASDSSRVGSGWILGKLSLLKGWWGIGKSSPGQWWSQHLWRCCRSGWGVG